MGEVEQEETEANTSDENTTDENGKVDNTFTLTCPVCFDELSEKTIELPWKCGHHICCNCLANMLGAPCPLCRVQSNICSRFGRPFRRISRMTTSFF